MAHYPEAVVCPVRPRLLVPRVQGAVEGTRGVSVERSAKKGKDPRCKLITVISIGSINGVRLSFFANGTAIPEICN